MLTISSAVALVSSCSRLCLVSASFPMSQFFTSGDQSVGISASASVLPMNIQAWFPFQIDWFDLLAVQVTLKSHSPTPQFKNFNFSSFSFVYSPTLPSMHDYWKNHSFD